MYLNIFFVFEFDFYLSCYILCVYYINFCLIIDLCIFKKLFRVYMIIFIIFIFGDVKVLLGV